MIRIRKLRIRIGYSLFTLVVVITIVSVLFYIFIPETPDQAINTAMENLAEARNGGALQYAPEKFSKASSYYDSAMWAWQNQNQRFILLRDYSRVVYFAVLSSDASLESIKLASRNSLNANQETASKYEHLKEMLRQIGLLYSSLPFPDSFRDQYSRAKLMLSEAKVARDKGDYGKAAEIMNNVDQHIIKIENLAENRMIEYFESFDHWENLYKSALQVSERNNAPLIVVDKLSRELKLYKDGKLKNTFHAEFGPNWIGDKNHQGDQATPEGSYLVVRKKEKRQTRYYKALLLNYPNSDDLERYRNNIKNGVIPKHIDVGGLIEIHGHGGQGFNWTNGCVALTDHEMDFVFRNTSVNTPVIIVGSLKPYKEWRSKTLAESHNLD